jgi:hypothetical protein
LAYSFKVHTLRSISLKLLKMANEIRMTLILFS